MDAGEPEQVANESPTGIYVGRGSDLYSGTSDEKRVMSE